MEARQPAEGTAPTEAAFRRVLGHFPSGVTVTTILGPREPMGMTVASFTSLSLHPPLVLVCIDRRAGMHDLVVTAPGFAVNVLAADGERTARWFASKTRHAGGMFDDHPWRPGPSTGAPILHEALAWLDCRREMVHPGGDHSIVVGRVAALEVARPDAAPLIWFQGGFDLT